IAGTCVTISYIMTAGIGLGLPQSLSQPVGIAVGVVCLVALIIAHNKRKTVLDTNS
ncbi:MAG: carbon starvation CstA family protein, partial [Shewanella sp.]